MKRINKCILLIIAFLLCVPFNGVSAANYSVTITGNSVSLRTDTTTKSTRIASLSKGAVYTAVDNTLYSDQYGCSNGWYKIKYNNSTGFVCAAYATISLSSNITDVYGRPWTSPKAAIVGGAKFISASYIQKGQFTSYLKKFNVNPNGYYKVYNHQYMANLAAPYSEAYSSYKSYRDNGLLSLPLEFTIPVYNNMPSYTVLPGSSADTSCESNVTDSSFEAALDAQGFPESYKCKLRLIHNTYSNWTFIAMHTGLDFESAITAEKSVSSIQGGDKYYDLSSGSRISTENGWYVANRETVGYYLDPRNFLKPERILMFENLGYSSNYTESVVQSIISNTFMSGYSFIDNQSYASIFVEAGQTASISAVYLASLARQESGTNGSRATTGAQFTYEGVTYKGLYNFFNIGAYSSASSPVLAGLVWAAGGSDSVIVTDPSDNNDVTVSGDLSASKITYALAASISNGVLTNIGLGTKYSEIKNNLKNYSVSINGIGDNDILKTGQVITISDGNNSLTYTIAIKGDVDGDGVVGATDYVKIKNYIMEKAGSELDIARSIAADADGNGSVGATDYVKIKNSIMER